MTRKDDFIERLEAYLDDYEGMTPLPDALRDAVRAELPHTRQVSRSRPLPRILNMTLRLPPTARYGLVAAVAVVAVVLGAAVFSRGGSVGGPTPSPSPSLAPSASPTAGPTSAQPWSLVDSPLAGDLPAGDYYLELPAYPARIDFTVPEGWFYYTPSSRTAADVNVILVNSEDTGAANGSAWGLAFTIVDQVRVDPCDAAAGLMDRLDTQSADALATAFGTWTDFPTTVEDVTIGGFSGKRVEVTVAETVTCTAGLFYTPSGYRFDVEPASREPFANPSQFTFLDVNGSVLVIWTTDYPGTNRFEVDGGASPDPEAHVADQVQLHAILDSIVITPR